MHITPRTKCKVDWSLTGLCALTNSDIKPVPISGAILEREDPNIKHQGTSLVVAIVTAKFNIY